MYAGVSAVGQNLASRMGEANSASAPRVIEPGRPTLYSAIDNAHRIGSRLDETGDRLNAMADVAEQLASRLCGSYPTEGPAKDVRGVSGDRGPMSTVEAVNAAVDGLHPRISGFENPMSRIVRAIEMIEQATG